jgi:hypothetical protein
MECPSCGSANQDLAGTVARRCRSIVSLAVTTIRLATATVVCVALLWLVRLLWNEP